MGSRKKKKKKSSVTMDVRGWFVSRLFPSKMKRSSNKVSSPISKRKRLELKDMRKLSSNDETFHLHWMTIGKIIDNIRSRRTPTPQEYMQWDEYAISFYLKMCTCFGVDYQHLEAASEADCRNKPLLSSTSLKQQEEHTEGSRVNQPITQERLIQCGRKQRGFCRLILRRPFEFGSYIHCALPDRVPYHLYLLAKEAVDIMMRPEWFTNTNDVIDLRRVENKIHFFCHYFRSHLPSFWKYDRNKVCDLVASYDPTRKPRYDMTGYIPFSIRDQVKEFESDAYSSLSRQGIVDTMGILHSRRTPVFWKMFPQQISFYCKLCSCFGVDYHRLEAAAEDDVCLMNMGS